MSRGRNLPPVPEQFRWWGDYDDGTHVPEDSPRVTEEEASRTLAGWITGTPEEEPPPAVTGADAEAELISVGTTPLVQGRRGYVYTFMLTEEPWTGIHIASPTEIPEYDLTDDTRRYTVVLPHVREPQAEAERTEP